MNMGTEERPGVGALRVEKGKDEVGTMGASKQGTHGVVRPAWPEEGKAQRAHREGADMLSLCLWKSVLGSQLSLRR